MTALGLGCWALGGGDYWGEVSQDNADRVVRRAVDLGITYFDTAEAYNEGRSEESLGEAIKGLPRDRLIIGTKVAPSNTEPDTLVEHCDASLRRLGTDYVDLYMVHWPITPQAIGHFTDGPGCPKVLDAFATLVKLQQQGRIRHIGVSNFGVERLQEACDSGAPITVNQLPYNLLCRAIERAVLPYCCQQGVGVIGYMTLLQGLLADVYPSLDDVPLWQRRTRHFHPRRAGEFCRHGESGAEAETEQALAAIRRIASEHGMAMPELALKWALATDGVSSVLVGTRSASRLEANAQAASKPLDPAIVESLNAATLPLMEKLGPSLDYYEHTDNDRTR